MREDRMPRSSNPIDMCDSQGSVQVVEMKEAGVHEIKVGARQTAEGLDGRDSP